MLSKPGKAIQQIRQLRRVRKQLEAITTEGAAGGGKVTVRVDGARKVREVSIAPELVEAGDARLIERLVQTAVNDAMKNLDRQLQAQMSRMPDLGGMLGGIGGA